MPPKIFDWIDLKDEKQCEWAIKYLLKNGLTLQAQPRPYSNNHLTLALQSLPLSEGEQVALSELMKKAWSTKKSRAKKAAQCAISLVVDKTTRSTFNRLVSQSGKSQSDFFTSLIEQAHNLDRYKEEELKRLKRELREQNQRKPIRSATRNTDQNRGEMEKELVQLKLVMSSLAQELCRAEVTYESLQEKGSPASQEDLDNADRRADRMISALESVSSKQETGRSKPMEDKASTSSNSAPLMEDPDTSKAPRQSAPLPAESKDDSLEPLPSSQAAVKKPDPKHRKVILRTKKTYIKKQ